MDSQMVNRGAVVAAFLAALAPGAVALTAGPLASTDLALLVSAALLVLALCLVIRTGAVGRLAVNHLRRADELTAAVRRLEQQAAGMGPELQRERDNLSAVADAVGEVREALERERAELAALRDTVEGERDNLGKVASGLEALQAGGGSGVSDALGELQRQVDELREHVERESRNLGLVAGGVDELRRSVSGVGMTTQRYTALSDALLDLARQVDALKAQAGASR